MSVNYYKDGVLKRISGGVNGKNAIVSSIIPISGGNRVTFQWTLDDGTVQAQTVDVMDGVDGDDGFSPMIIENQNNTDTVYKLDIITNDAIFTTPNLKGANGIIGGQTNPLQYYGTDVNNNLGFHYFENAGGIGSTSEVRQYVALECAANTDIIIGFSNFDESQKYNVQCYKLTDAINDTVQTLKLFNNSEAENFHYDSDNVEFTDNMHIITEHTYDIALNSDGCYESEVIDKNEYYIWGGDINGWYV